MKKLFATLVALFVFSVVATPAFADTCEPVYGAVYGGVNCPPSIGLTIEKKVQNPDSKQFVDNLGMDDPKFGPDSNILFQLVVKNTGKKQLDQVFVKDVFPDSLIFTGGQGNFDANTRTISFEVDNLKAGESRTFTLAGKIVSANKLPNQMVTCQTNQAFATTNGMSSQDNAQFCIQLKVGAKGGPTVFPAPKLTQTPGTGPEAFALLGLIPAAFAGLKLRKKARN